MKEKETTLAISAESAQSGDSNYAEIAEVSNPHTGEDENPDAGEKNSKYAEFEALIKGKYKEQFSHMVQKIISKRLKEVKKLKETTGKNERIISMLMKKFNIEDNDTDKLERMIDSDMTDSNTINEKNATNKRVAEVVRRLMEENSYLKRNHEAQIQSIQMRGRVELWKAQAQEAKKAYPEFDFEKELENPEFCRLLKVGVSVKNAYEVINIDTILDSNSKDAERKVVDSIRTKGKRPVENGSDASGGVLLSGNVSKLSKKQRAELAKRAAKGEKISF